MNPPRQLLQNAIFIPSEDLYLKSVHVHDYVVHEPREGVSYSVDGGLEYLRRGWGPDNSHDSWEEWSLYEDDSYHVIATKMLWGTRGRGGKQPLRYRPIASLELDHLQAIVATQWQIKGKLAERVVQHWIDLKS